MTFAEAQGGHLIGLEILSDLMKKISAERRNYKLSEEVAWMWLGREIIGKVISVHPVPVAKEIKGKIIKRNGSPENPAYLVESKAGNLALKLHSELKIASKSKKTTFRSPKIFSS